MTQKEINQKIKSLEEFENFEQIQVSAEWNQSLLHRIELSKNSKKTTFNKSKLLFSLSILFCLNIGFLSSFIIQKNQQSEVNIASEKADLEILSDQLNINLN